MSLPAALAGLTPPAVEVEDLVGTWHIVRTNFPMWLAGPMWLGGDRREPTLNYARIPDQPGQLEDVVRFRRKGAVKTIVGVDRQDPGCPSHFVWRGKGLLRALRSDWYVVALDREVGLAAIYFTKTLFTPAGVDIVARDPALDADRVRACVEALGVAPGLRGQLDRLVPPGSAAVTVDR